MAVRKNFMFLVIGILICVVIVPVYSNEDKICEKINEFSLNLIRTYYEEQSKSNMQNFVISPISVWSMFLLLSKGASGKTLKQMREYINLPKSENEMQEAYNLLSHELIKSTSDVSLKKKSFLFINKNAEIKPKFIESINDGSEVFQLDLSERGKVEDILNDINNKVLSLTDGHINSTVDWKTLSDSMLSIINVISFKGIWTYPFRTTKIQDFFYKDGKQSKKVVMMKSNAPARKIFLDKVEVLEIPYGSSNSFSMLILLPHEEESIENVLIMLKNNTLTWLQREDNHMNITEYSIPKFMISSDINLIPLMEKMGVKNIFHDNLAELNGISNVKLSVSKTQQQITIDVNEEGTKTYSKTNIHLNIKSMIGEFVANREFIFLLIKKNPNVVMFGGIYSGPNIN